MGHHDGSQSVFSGRVYGIMVGVAVGIAVGVAVGVAVGDATSVRRYMLWLITA